MGVVCSKDSSDWFWAHPSICRVGFYTRYSIAIVVAISFRYLGSNNIEKTFSSSVGQNWAPSTQTRCTEAGEVSLPILCSTTKWHTKVKGIAKKVIWGWRICGEGATIFYKCGCDRSEIFSCAFGAFSLTILIEILHSHIWVATPLTLVCYLVVEHKISRDTYPASVSLV